MDWKSLSAQKINMAYKRLFLNQCYICGIKSYSVLCKHCQSTLPLNTSHCTHCKRPTEKAGILCGNCQLSLPDYQQCIAPYLFEGIIKTLIHSIKFNQGNYYIRPLIHALSEHLAQAYESENWPEQIIYVPSHPNRVKERGFCQTKMMSNHLLKHLQWQLGDLCPKVTHKNPLQKSRHTQAQHLLSRKERLKKQKNSYTITSQVSKHVALFDDVMTTGSTIESCTQLLLKAGAERVDIWVIARTPNKKAQ